MKKEKKHNKPLKKNYKRTLVASKITRRRSPRKNIKWNNEQQKEGGRRERGGEGERGGMRKGAKRQDLFMTQLCKRITL